MAEQRWAQVAEHRGIDLGAAAPSPPLEQMEEEPRLPPLSLGDRLEALCVGQANLQAEGQQAQQVWGQQLLALQNTVARLLTLPTPPPAPVGAPVPQPPAVPVEGGPGHQGFHDLMLPMALTPLPNRFGGDPQEYQQFMLKCKMHFQARPTHFDTDAKKVRFMALLMEGSAFKWVAPYLARDDPLLEDYDAFLQHFGTVFQKQYHAQSRRQEFLGLQQGARDVISYVAEFQAMAAEEEWSEVARIALLHKGLNENLKDVLMLVEPLPETMNAYIGLVLRMEHRLGERKKLQLLALESRPVAAHVESPVSHPTEEPMEIGAVRITVSSKERDRRRQARLCFYCGKAGHMIRQCPTKPSSGNALAVQEKGD